MIKTVVSIRILPVTIFVAVLLLSVKVGDIWNGVTGLGDTLSVAGAEAQQPSAAPAATTAAVEPESALPTGGDKNTRDAAKKLPVMSAEDPTLFTQSEIDLLQQLADRRNRLDARAKEFDVREGLLQAAETRINTKIQGLKVLQTTIEGLIKKHSAQQKKQMTRLVKIYENMKPKDAARIFEEMEMETLLIVIEGMKERKLAPILAKMNPAKAKEMTVELARLRDLPIPDNISGG